MLGLLTLYHTWRSTPSSYSSPAAAAAFRRQSLDLAVILGSIYWLAGFCAVLFPEAEGLDPEFGGPGFPQAWIFGGFMASGVAGWLVARGGA